jgi:hypothetical protein
MSRFNELESTEYATWCGRGYLVHVRQSALNHECARTHTHITGDRNVLCTIRSTLSAPRIREHILPGKWSLLALLPSFVSLAVGNLIMNPFNATSVSRCDIYLA